MLFPEALAAPMGMDCVTNLAPLVIINWFPPEATPTFIFPYRSTIEFGPVTNAVQFEAVLPAPMLTPELLTCPPFLTVTLQNGPKLPTFK